MQQTNTILIIADPNGADKTTFAREYLLNVADYTSFVNADLIAVGLNPLQPEQEAISACRMMPGMIRRYVNEGRSLAFGTTLSGRSYASMIPRWQEQGYRVSLVFLSLPSPEVVIERVKQRVQDGGHNIPEDIIRRRFDVGRRNFNTTYRPVVHQWALYDSSGDAPTLLVEGENS